MAVADEKPRMSAADAEARFEALVAQHRSEKQSGRARKVVGKSDDRMAALAVVLVYCLGVAAGAVWHVKPLGAVLVGVPLILIVRSLLKRRRDRLGSP
jgi:hypothetical protein